MQSKGSDARFDRKRTHPKIQEGYALQMVGNKIFISIHFISNGVMLLISSPSCLPSPSSPWP